MPIKSTTCSNGCVIKSMELGEGESYDDLFKQAGFMDDGQVSTLTKDLKTFLTGWQKQPRLYKEQTLALSNPNVMESGMVDQDKFQSWSGMVFPQVVEYLTSKTKKKVDGEDWCVGGMGSIWKDMELGGIPFRLCYYSRKHNKSQFPNYFGIHQEHHHILMLDPHRLEKLN
jgi:hypothetical protein